jgi:hypothetical protein
MEPESSLPYSQVPATCPYPEPAPSSPHNPLPPPEDLERNTQFIYENRFTELYRKVLCGKRKIIRKNILRYATYRKE